MNLFFFESSLFSLILRPPLSVVLLAPSFHLSGTITFPNFFSPETKQKDTQIKCKTKQNLGFKVSLTRTFKAQLQLEAQIEVVTELTLRTDHIVSSTAS